MDRIVTFLLLLVAAVLLVPGCIADEHVLSEEIIVSEVEVIEPEVSEETEVPAEEVVAEETEVLDEAEVELVPDFIADVNTTELNMTLEQTVLVQLAENPTTGYTWNVTLSEGLVVLSDEYIQDEAEEGMVGVGGIHEWIIQAVETGEQTLFGIEKQEWEEETGEENTYTLAILVE